MSVIHPGAAEAIEADAGILQAFGMRVQHAAEGVCELTVQVPTALINAGGYAHGSISYSMMDTAAAYALRSLERRGVTSQGSISYVRGAGAGSELLGRVTVASLTRRVATLRGEVMVVDGDETLLAAHGSFVFQLRAED